MTDCGITDVAITETRHILMTADTVGGVWTYAIGLSRGLMARGIRVSLATMGAPLSAHQQSEAAGAGIAVHESSYKLEWMEQPWREVDAAGDWLLHLENKIRPDLIHLNNYAHGSLPWQAPVVTVGHSCVYSWWNAVHGAEAPSSHWAEYRRRVRAGLQASNMAVAVSRTMLRELQRWYGLGSGAVVYNAHRAEAFAPGRKEEMVLTTGRIWDAAKNIGALDAAAASMQWPAYVAGEARHPGGGRATLQHAQPLGRLSSDEVRPWFARAAIYVSPALYEPFGLSVLEAALSGCVLVLGDIPSLREIWGEAAVYVASRDHQALALRVNSLIRQPAARQALARRATERALGFTVDRMVNGYLDVYRQARAKYSAKQEAESSCVS